METINKVNLEEDTQKHWITIEFEEAIARTL